MATHAFAASKRPSPLATIAGVPVLADAGPLLAITVRATGADELADRIEIAVDDRATGSIAGPSAEHPRKGSADG